MCYLFFFVKKNEQRKRKKKMWSELNKYNVDMMDINNNICDSSVMIKLLVGDFKDKKLNYTFTNLCYIYIRNLAICKNCDSIVKK